MSYELFMDMKVHAMYTRTPVSINPRFGGLLWGE